MFASAFELFFEPEGAMDGVDDVLGVVPLVWCVGHQLVEGFEMKLVEGLGLCRHRSPS